VREPAKRWCSIIDIYFVIPIYGLLLTVKLHVKNYVFSVQNTIEMSYPSCLVGYPPLKLHENGRFPPSRE